MTTDDRNVTNDAFALRNRETLALRFDGIADDDRYAVLAAPIPGLPSPAHEVSAHGDKVESMAIIAAEKVSGRWQWMNLAPDAKRIVGDALFDTGLADGKWHGMRLSLAKETDQ